MKMDKDEIFFWYKIEEELGAKIPAHVKNSLQ